ncbi:MAG: hypothetical protein QG635_1215, partial [Bacteroidota bacterium]|nr:hypothetical protein [Bacteroidota bacterium]
WTFGINLNYTYSKYSINNSTETINLSANLTMTLTSTWQLTASAQFDFESHELRAPSISLMKDFHCWALVFNWYPIGYNSGFFLKLGIKSQQLQDLFYKKESSPIY